MVCYEQGYNFLAHDYDVSKYNQQINKKRHKTWRVFKVL